MKRLTTFLSLAFAVMLTACAAGLQNRQVVGSNKYVTKEIRVKPFKKLSLMSSFDVYFTQQTGTPKVEIYTSDNLVDLVDVLVSDGVLTVEFKEGYSLKYKKLKVHVFAPDLEMASLMGSGNLVFRNELSTDHFELDQGSMGNVTAPGIRSRGGVQIAQYGSGSLEIGRLSCDGLNVYLGGSGGANIRQIVCGNVDVSMAGSGDFTVESLKGGDVRTDQYGTGDLNIGEVSCKELNSSVHGGGTNLGETECTGLEVTIAGTSDFLFKSLKTGRMKTWLYGSGNLGIGELLCTELISSIGGTGGVSFGTMDCTGLDVSMSGSGDFQVETLKAERVKTDMYGSGDFSVNKATCVEVIGSLAGTGNISLSGTAETADFNTSGSGDVDASRLKAKRVKAYSAGSGDISCYASESLEAEAIGNGEIGYAGNPAKVGMPDNRIHPL